jgi:hypothetical protein
MTDGNDTDDQQLSHVPMEPEVLKSKGNEAFQTTLKKKMFLCFISLAKVTKCPFKTTAFVATLLHI